MPRLITIEPGVFLDPDAKAIEFEKDHQTWPLPEEGHPGSVLLAAYAHLVWLDREKRQRVIRCLRKAIALMRERERLQKLEPGTIHTVEAYQRLGLKP